jgi:hypothetical protein
MIDFQLGEFGLSDRGNDASLSPEGQDQAKSRLPEQTRNPEESI